MAVRNSLVTMLFVLALGGCAQLTAEHPLFSVTDQGWPPVHEGIWIGIGDGCSEDNLRQERFASDCTPFEVGRQEDGSWRVRRRFDLVEDMTERERRESQQNGANDPFSVILAPAVEREAREGYAPLYIAELGHLDAEVRGVSYMVLAPITSTPGPAFQMRLVRMSCHAILLDGPVEGITPRYETRDYSDGVSQQELVGCTASSQAAVREAARRAVIENLKELTERRYVYVRAN